MATFYRQRVIAAGLVSGEQVFEKVVPAKSRPRFLVPPGTRCAVRNVVKDEWLPHTTTKESGFEKFDRYEKNADGAFYEFRLGQWVLLVHRRHVVHREDINRLAADLDRALNKNSGVA
jgi:hypothetical protein